MTEPDEGWTPGDVAGLIANPHSAITFAPHLFGEHATIVDEETWVQANVQLIDELGPEAYLRNLLIILKSGGPAASADASPDPVQPRRPRPSRNQPCSCGSGRKYKHCHGSRA